MKRRTFIAGLGSAVAWPVASPAQQGDRVRRIGVLLGGDENDPGQKRRYSAFTQALADLGWTDERRHSHRCGYSFPKTLTLSARQSGPQVCLTALGPMPISLSSCWRQITPGPAS
jgi:hypothetical protein